MQPQGASGFYRGSDRILGGVCSGLAAGLHVDALWVRIAFVLLAFLQGIGLFIYVVLWLVMPERVEGVAGGRAGFDSMSDDLRRLGGEVRQQFGDLLGRPAAPNPATPAAEPAGGGAGSAAPAGRSSSVLPGLVLVLVGAFLLAANAGVVNWGVVWPAALIVLGIVLWVRSFGRRP
jgi:phage shock protein PspC (stress-responsive transcriptional regulator)